MAVVLNHVIVQHGLVDPVLGPAHKLRYGLHVLTLLSQVLDKERRRDRRAVKMELRGGGEETNQSVSRIVHMQ